MGTTLALEIWHHPQFCMRRRRWGSQGIRCDRVGLSLRVSEQEVGSSLMCKLRWRPWVASVGGCGSASVAIRFEQRARATLHALSCSSRAGSYGVDSGLSEEIRRATRCGVAHTLRHSRPYERAALHGQTVGFAFSRACAMLCDGSGSQPPDAMVLHECASGIVHVGGLSCLTDALHTCVPRSFRTWLRLCAWRGARMLVGSRIPGGFL